MCLELLMDVKSRLRHQFEAIHFHVTENMKAIEGADQNNGLLLVMAIFLRRRETITGRFVGKCLVRSSQVLEFLFFVQGLE